MQFAPIKAIFYAEFHPIHGPFVVYAVPEGSVVSGKGKDASANISQLESHSEPITNNDKVIALDSISDYVIPKPSLCNRLVSVSATASRMILGFPVSIEDFFSYTRNAFLFNLVFVFDANADVRPYHQIVKKLARILRTLELESNLLSREDSKHVVLNMIEQILQEMNTYFECKIPITDYETVNLKLIKIYSPPPIVFDWDVPVQVYRMQKFMDRYWDLTIIRIASHINGIWSIKRISETAHVEIERVRLAVQHLMYYGCVKIVDIFQVAVNLHMLVNTPELQIKLMNFIKRENSELKVGFSDVFRLLCLLKHGKCVRDWCLDNGVFAMKFDVRSNRRLFVFGVLHEILARVHKYPILYGSVPSMSPLGWSNEAITSMGTIMSATLSGPVPVDPIKLSQYLDGKHHMDEICTEFDCPPAKLEEFLLANASVRFIMK
ncbi:Nitrogen permease regulator 2 [Entophlyctis luteolus]|nr:Nitrogen permease regulator 2 [Entophlyctis luteolus]